MPQPERKYLSRRFWVILSICALILITCAIFVRVISAPSHGQITDSLPATLKISGPKQKPPAPASEIQTPYFNLALPVGYRQQASQTVSGLLYQQTIIKSSTSGSLVIAIGLSSLGAGLSDNSAYRLRTQDLGRYKITNQSVRGESVVIANDAQTAAVVAFWVHGDRLATISVSSGLQDPAANDNIDEIKALQPLLEAWHWQ